MTRSKEIQTITLGLENVDGIVVDISNIEMIKILDITGTDIFTSGDISEKISANEIFIKIREGSNVKTAYFTDWHTDDPSYPLPFDRLRKYGDIVYFEIKYIDGSKKVIYANWEGPDEYNYYQTSMYQDGGLCIAISPKTTVERYFKK